MRVTRNQSLPDNGPPSELSWACPVVELFDDDVRTSPRSVVDHLRSWSRLRS